MGTEVDILRRKLILFVSIAAVVVVPSALADATTSVYAGQGKGTQQTIGTLKPPTASTANDPAAVAAGQNGQPSAAGLPLTGIDLGFVVLAGIVVAGMGYGLRRFARDDTQ